MAVRRIGVASGLALLIAALTAVAANATQVSVAVPALQLSQESIDFEGVEVGERALRTLTITSVGDDILTIERAEVSGGDTDAFSADGCEGRKLAPDESCDVAVSFQPVEEGEARGLLVVSSNGRGGVRRVPLDGIGLPAAVRVPALELSRDRIDFGTVEVGSESAREVTVSNAGTADADIISVEIPEGGGEDFAIAADGCSQQTLAPEGSCGFSIAFRPSAAGQPSAVALVVSDALDTPHAVALVGSGAEPSEGETTVEVPDLIDMSLDEAEEAASAAGLALEPDDEGAVDAERATVERQEPAPGTRVAVGTAITVTLSADTDAGQSQGSDDSGEGEAVVAVTQRPEWLLAALLAAAAFAGLLRLLRGRRSAASIRAHVRFRARADPAFEVAAEHVDDRPSRTVRIVPRVDASATTVEEVPP